MSAWASAGYNRPKRRRVCGAERSASYAGGHFKSSPGDRGGEGGVCRHRPPGGAYLYQRQRRDGGGAGPGHGDLRLAQAGAPGPGQVSAVVPDHVGGDGRVCRAHPGGGKVHLLQRVQPGQRGRAYPGQPAGGVPPPARLSGQPASAPVEGPGPDEVRPGQHRSGCGGGPHRQHLCRHVPRIRRSHAGTETNGTRPGGGL